MKAAPTAEHYASVEDLRKPGAARASSGGQTLGVLDGRRTDADALEMVDSSAIGLRLYRGTVSHGPQLHSR